MLKRPTIKTRSKLLLCPCSLHQFVLCPKDGHFLPRPGDRDMDESVAHPQNVKDNYTLNFTWNDLKWLIGITNLPVIMKGILTGIINILNSNKMKKKETLLYYLLDNQSQNLFWSLNKNWIFMQSRKWCFHCKMLN